MFTCIDLIVSFIRDGSYTMLVNDEKQYLHEGLMDWICKKTPEAVTAIPSYLKIKWSVLIALLIKMDYPTLWPNVFEVWCSAIVSCRRYWLFAPFLPPTC